MTGNHKVGCFFFCCFEIIHFNFHHVECNTLVAGEISGSAHDMSLENIVHKATIDHTTLNFQVFAREYGINLYFFFTLQLPQFKVALCMIVFLTTDKNKSETSHSYIFESSFYVINTFETYFNLQN